MMSADDVLQVVAALEAAGVDMWVNGGWGIDALAGEQTRPHDDLDVFISSEHIEASQEALQLLGFESMTNELPQGFVLRDGADRRVDFHPLTIQADGSGIQYRRSGGTWVLPPAGFQATGRIAGRQVRCIPPEEQAREHLGYEPNETDHRDMRLLHGRFGTLLPPPYGQA